MFISAYVIGIFLAGLYCLILEVRRVGSFNGQQLPAWNIAFWDFIQRFGCAVVVYLLSSMLAAEVTKDWNANEALEPWRIVIIGYAAHGSILLLLASMFHPYLRRHLQVNFAESSLVFSVQRLPITKFFQWGLLSFLAAIPIIFVASAGWEQVLLFLNNAGFEISMDRQAQVEMFTEYENLPATILLIVLAVIVAPISEELFFRGCVYRYFKGRMPTALAMLASAALFSSIHGNWLAAAPLFILGILLCYAYERHGNIFVSMAMHGFFNANTILILFLAPDLDSL
ncbi:CPBP family intramembrane glutamic endopeptidase [Cerasicoccus fimbriatus]|uniref:CPBP family intramembrane glutamic endopeptidase n=1 Tax=Cerasicoccus fimbriatus TaxID=3014554 RepID=UPI0022B40F04|nr:CPBP family intramembrane glutamic endopeptidase [Cerasicoccus sp. TK19100]